MNETYGPMAKTALLGFAVLAVLALLVELLVPIHAKFEIAQSFGFFAWYAFAACVALIVIGRVLGAIIRRPEDYYDR